MKWTKFAELLVIAVALNFAAVGCKHHPTPLTPIPGSATGGGGEAGKGGTLEGEGGTGEGVAATPLADPSKYKDYPPNADLLKDYTVQFAYDSSVVRSGEKPKVAAVADYLRNHPADALKIEGHCDERGTDQYNYTLGERRALALREELIASGIDGGRVLTESFGRSRPIDTGHSEAAHARNRRGAFIVLTAPK
jgi:peptidoglycan-associated lipoprotein